MPTASRPHSNAAGRPGLFADWFMPHRLREARRLAGFVAPVPLTRPAEFLIGDVGSDRTSWPAPSPGAPESIAAIAPEEDALLEVEIEPGLSELARARVLARWIGQDHAIDVETGAEDAPRAVSGDLDPHDGAVAEPAIEEAVASATEPAKAASPDLALAADDDVPTPVELDPGVDVSPHEAAADVVSPLADEPVTPEERVAEAPILAETVPAETVPAETVPAEPAPPPMEAVSAEPEPVRVPDWRVPGSRNGSTHHGEDFLVSIRSVLDGATRNDCQMSAALIDLHLDLIICANGKQPEVEAAAEAVRQAGIGFFAALYRDGAAEAERASAEAATDRLQASLAA